MTLRDEIEKLRKIENDNPYPKGGILWNGKEAGKMGANWAFDNILSLLPDNILDADVVVGFSEEEANHIKPGSSFRHRWCDLCNSIYDKLSQALKEKK